jgi:hypothetical protein
MNDEQIKEILNDQKKLFNLFRLFHQLVHLYDEKEMREEIAREKEKGGTMARAGLGDTLSIILKDKDGKIKQEKSN